MSRWNDWGWYPPAVPKEAEGGIAARSRRGDFGENWWAKRWIACLESLGQSNRLQRGRRYARSGQVIDFEVLPGEVTAKVQGTRSRPYDITIALKPFTRAQWKKALEVLAGKAAFAASLLAGEMPPDIEEAFAEAGLSLLPADDRQLDTDCSCPDWANPCKHIAATHYILGEEFDRDPFLIFHLRGRSREELLEELRERWGGATDLAGHAEDDEPVEPLDLDATAFWGDPSRLDGFPLRLERPPVAAAVVKRLGEPPFWRGAEPFVEVMGRLYQTVTERALREAFAEDD